LRQYPVPNAAASPAVTMLEASFERGVVLDRILQKVNQHRRSSSAKVCTHVELVAFPAGFSCERREGVIACSFWHSRAVRTVRFCDGEASR
jgi:hypothetical protein